jgi:hypothetical protein
MNPTKNRGVNSGAPEGLGVPVLLVTPGDKSSMRKGPGSVYDKWNTSVVICERFRKYQQHCILFL